MSTRIVTLFGEEIVPEVPKPAAKPRAKKKGRADGDETDADGEDDTETGIDSVTTEDASAASAASDDDAGAMHDFAMVAAVAADMPPAAMVDPTTDDVVADNLPQPVEEESYTYDAMVQEYAAVAAMASIELLVSADETPEAETQVPEAAAEMPANEAIELELQGVYDEAIADVATPIDAINQTDPAAEIAIDDTGITVHTNPRHSFVAVAHGHNPSHTGAPLVTATDRRSLLAGIRGGNSPKGEPVPDVTAEAMVPEDVITVAPATEMQESESEPSPKAKKAPSRKRVLADDAAQDGETPNIIPADWKGEKNYYTIGEVAALFEVKTSHIRFWTNEFALKVRTTRKGDRLYTPDQVRELRAIYHLVKERGFTLAGAKAKLKAPKSLEVTTVDLKTSLTALRNKLQILRDRL